MPFISSISPESKEYADFHIPLALELEPKDKYTQRCVIKNAPEIPEILTSNDAGSLWPMHIQIIANPRTDDEVIQNIQNEIKH